MTFDPDELGRRMERECPEVVFATLHGSARGGIVHQGSDIDIALYLSGEPRWGVYDTVMRIVEEVAGPVRADIGILNGTEPVYRFETLRGRLLFCRDWETYARFFSLTCREYESQMASYARQQQYRLAALAGRDGATPTRA